MNIAIANVIGANRAFRPKYDANYQAVLDYAMTQGYTLPSAGQRVKQNKLLVDLKSAGVWTKLDTFANFATDGSSDFALIDWKRLNLYTRVNSPTFTSNQGFAGNGTSSYIDTNFNPATSGSNYKLNDASRVLFMFMSGALAQPFDGIFTGSANRTIRGSTNTNYINNLGNAMSSPFDFTAVNGMKSIHRTSSTNIELFNGTTQGSRTSTSTLITSANQFILRAGTNYGNHEISMYAMGSNLVSENTAFVNAFNTYITSL